MLDAGPVERWNGARNRAHARRVRRKHIYSSYRFERVREMEGPSRKRRHSPYIVTAFPLTSV